MTPAEEAFTVFIEAAQERFALDAAYRARVQKEVMNTDADIAVRMRRWEDRLWAEARDHAA